MKAFELSETLKMKIDTPEFKKLLTPGLLKLGELYSKNHRDLRIVGGAVRDLILQKEPKDIDLATTALPQESLKLLKANGINTIETGLQHGTITAVIDSIPYEITTLRVDVETDGRHAEVEFTNSWEKDAERRDLTANAMSIDLDGNLYDYFGGVSDIKSGKTKFVGDAEQRIQEDYLRILRYFRFKGRSNNLEFDKDIFSAIRHNSKGLDNISGERIWMEMKKILSIDKNNIRKIIGAMGKAGVGVYIGLDLIDLYEFANVAHKVDDPYLRLASLIDTVDDLNTLDQRWKFSQDEKQLLTFIIENRDQSIDWQIVQDMYTNKKIKKEWVLKLLKYNDRSRMIEKLKNWVVPTFPVTGYDLIQAGIKQGPELGEKLKELEDHWKRTGYKKTKDELLKSAWIYK